MAATLAALGGLVGCSSSTTTVDALAGSTAPASVEVVASAVGGLGDVLTSGGRPLYVFSPDHHAAVTCTGVCQGTWPALKVTTSAHAGAGVLAADLGTISSPGFGRIVTLKGWPLYFYAGDTDVSDSDASDSGAHGQALFLNGGPWYTIRASGEIVTIGAK